MDSRRGISRRRLLTSQLSVVTLAALAGCTDGGETVGSAENDGSRTSQNGVSDPETTAESETTDSADGVDLDLREANVDGVSFETDEVGTYTFDVTLHHDDDGEDGYANWWQVERLDGTRLGRRDLLHAHSRQPFTRSETIEIPDDVTCVVVRGHDQTHEYGGVAAIVDLDSGDTRSIDQGSEKRAFDSSDCP